MFCPNTLNKVTIGTQDECQSLCKQNDSCAGISYSRKLTTTRNNCYICLDDKLKFSLDGFGFYKMAGIYENYFLFQLYLQNYTKYNCLLFKIVIFYPVPFS